MAGRGLLEGLEVAAGVRCRVHRGPRRRAWVPARRDDVDAPCCGIGDGPIQSQLWRLLDPSVVVMPKRASRSLELVRETGTVGLPSTS